MFVAGIDIETTGLLADDHRIIEIYISLWHQERKVYEYDQRIDPKRAIAADAQRVHGITIGDLFGKPTWQEVAPTVVKVLSKATYYVWHNGKEFDGPFIDMELKRVGLALPERPQTDTMLEGVWATPDGKKPRLSELAFACGVPYDPSKAHAAHYDVDVMMECYFRALKWGYYGLPVELGTSLAAA